MDGTSKPQVLVDRAIPLLDDQIFNARYSVSPDGSVALRSLASSDHTTEIEALDLETGATLWTARAAGAWSALMWSGDGRSALGYIDAGTEARVGVVNVAEGRVSLFPLSRDRSVVGFALDGNGIVVTDFDLNRIATGVHYYRWEPVSGIFTPIAAAEADTVEGLQAPGSADLLPGLDSFLDVTYSQDIHQLTAIVTNASTGVQTVPDGLINISSASLDNSRRRILVWADEGVGINVNSAFRPGSLYLWEPGGLPRLVWNGSYDGYPEQATSTDDRYVAFQPTYSSLDLVLLDMVTERTATIPMPHLIVAASVVRVVGGAPLIDSPVAADPYPPDPVVPPPGAPIVGAPQALSSTTRVDPDGSSTLVLSEITPAVGGSVAALALAEFPLGSGSKTYGYVLSGTTGRDHLVAVYSEPDYCCVPGHIWRWQPGAPPVEMRIPAAFVHVSGLIASPDGRRVAGLSLSGLKLVSLDLESGQVRVLHLPESARSTNAFAWTADGRSVLMERGTYTEGGCDPEPAILAADVRSGTLSHHRRSEVAGLTGLASQPEARIGPSPGYVVGGRTLRFGGACTGTPPISVRLPPGLTIMHAAWSEDGTHLLVLARSSVGNRLLRYDTHGIRLDRQPGIVRLPPGVLRDLFAVDSPTANGRWAVVTTEDLLGSPTDNTGFLDLRTGVTYWPPAELSFY